MVTLDGGDGRPPLWPPRRIQEHVPYRLGGGVDLALDDEPSVPGDTFDSGHTPLTTHSDVRVRTKRPIGAPWQAGETTNWPTAVRPLMEVAPGICTHAIEWSYGEYVEPLSVHVVEGETTVLVGGGDESIAEAVLDVARTHDVDVVLVEHAHIDHYGAVPTIRRELDVDVAIPAGDAATLREVGIEPDVTLEDGDQPWGIEAIATPGHTPGNMAYRAGDVLLAGDTVVASDSVFAASEDWSGPLAVIEARFNTDDAAARRSVARLREIDVERVPVSHGSHVLDGAEEAIQTLCRDLDASPR